MGSGKTILAIAVADAFQDLREVLIVAPGHLRAVWEQEFRKYGLQATNIRRFSFLSYELEDLQSLATRNLSRSLVVLDEAHNVVRGLKSLNDGVVILRRLQASGKILLMSGTPIYDDEMDFPYLVNIAAGKDVITVDPVQFREKFTKLHLLRAGFSGYWKPGFSLLHKAFGYLAPVVALWNMLIMYIQYRKLTGSGESALKPVANSLGFVLGAVGYPMRLVMNRFLPSILSAFGADKETGQVVAEKLRDPATAIGLSFALTCAVCLLMVIINWLASKAFGTEQLSTRVLNASKFKPYIAQFVSFHKLDTGSRDFARVRHVEGAVPYTTSQMDFFLKFCNGLLSGQDLGKMVADLPATKANMFPAHLQSKFDENIENGLKIGNLDIGTQPPLKFQGILETSQGQPTVVYSIFIEHGAQPLQKFLKARNQSVVTFTKQDDPSAIRQKVASFNDGTSTFAILHPGLTEGLSFKGVRHVHFLEPVLQQATREQIIARGVRYQSHAHLPASERLVTVHTWVAKMPLASFGHTIQRLKFWWNFKTEFIPGTEVHNFNYNKLKPVLKKQELLTPDVIQLSRIATFGENVKGLLAALQKYSIERSKARI